MAHGIQKPHDIVLSTEGTEWHGIAKQVEAITETEVNPILFPIVESPCFVHCDGKQIELSNHKVLVADHRGCRDDLTESECLVPLHIPKSGYKVISNRQIWEVMNKSLSDLGVKVTSAGTLEGGKKFFLSCDIGGSDRIIAGDKFRNSLNFITSHDGTGCMKAYDSAIRIVCMNTFQWSQDAAGSVGFKAYHTKNADLATTNLPELLNAILTGRADLENVMEYLASHSCDYNDAIAMAAGYFVTTTGSKLLSTRSKNAARSIANLFEFGMGNKGKSLYDLANGATEYWTSGEGTGKEGTSQADRVYKSEIGAASEHKIRFISLIQTTISRASLIEKGKEAISLFN